MKGTVQSLIGSQLVTKESAKESELLTNTTTTSLINVRKQASIEERDTKRHNIPFTHIKNNNKMGKGRKQHIKHKDR